MFRSGLLLACVLFASAGCGIVKITTAEDRKREAEERERKAQADKPKSTGNFWDDVDLRTYPETAKLLADGDSALERGAHQEAIDAARKGRESVAREYEGKKLKDVVVSEAHTRVISRLRLLEGLGWRGLGKDVEALLSLGDGAFTSSECKGDRRARCDEHIEWLMKTFPAIVKSSYVEMHATGGLLGPGLNTILMDIYEREIKAKKGWILLAVEPTSKKDAKAGVTLRVDGETSHDSYDDCNKIGTARIGGVDFDVERCRKQAYTAPRANFVVDVSTEDAAKLTGKPGERAYVLVEVKSWKRTGNLYSAGQGRIAFTRLPR